MDSFPASPGGGGEKRRGVALVMTLAILSIITILLVSFVSLAMRDSSSTRSYSESLRAAQIAQGGLDQVVSLLQAEAADPVFVSVASSNAGHLAALPLAASNAPPQAMLGAAFYPAVKESGMNFYRAGIGLTNLASASCTTNAAANGRRVTPSRWMAPQLLVVTAGFPPPAWIVVGRSGPVPVAGPTVPSGSGPGLASANEVLGRYAYVVYDTSGLLDATVAGYSGAAAPAGKGLAPWADLTRLGLSQAMVDDLVAWRNAANASSYGTYVPQWATNGFRMVANGDTTFLGRQDLIQYAQNNGFAAALPYLTTFSRELNGSSWAPPSPYDSSAALTGGSGPTNFFVPSVRVAGADGSSPFTRDNGLPARAGEPLAKYRFPLAKLALLEKMQGNPVGASTLSTQDISDIARYFGLDPVADSSGLYRHWRYPTTSTAFSHPQTARIQRLDEVAALNREPDFFELLKAGILSGSLGKAGRGDALAGASGDPDASADVQVVRIGADIIDQWDADSCPTTVTFNGLDLYGIEDLPYISQVHAAAVPGAPAATQPATGYIYFGLWNPHRPSPANPAPPNLRLVPLGSGGAQAGTYGFQYALSATNAWSAATTGTFPTNGAILFTVASTNVFRANGLLSGPTGPATVPGSSPAVPAFSITASTLPASADKAADGATTWTAGAANASLLLSVTNLVFALEFEAPAGSGVFHPYGLFTGVVTNAAPPSYPVAAGATTPAFDALFLTNAAGATLATLPCLTKADPRTTRWAASWNTSGSSLYAPSRLLPFGLADGAACDLTQTCSNTTASAYADPDGVVRPGDNAAGSGPFSSASWSGAGDPRPVVLNRPFVSVGELGYAFRDLPWKSLDFWSGSSADAALLDLFTLTEGPVAAGRYAPSTLYDRVPRALLIGAGTSVGTTAQLGDTDALALADALTNSAPYLLNRADLASRFMTNAAVTSLSTVKGEREAVVRALAESANTRTWDFLIDVVAQAGRYPPAAASIDQFVVTGERRYWLHIAIDRYTGEIVDRQLEPVSE